MLTSRSGLGTVWKNTNWSRPSSSQGPCEKLNTMDKTFQCSVLFPDTVYFISIDVLLQSETQATVILKPWLLRSCVPFSFQLYPPSHFPLEAPGQKRGSALGAGLYLAPHTIRKGHRKSHLL